MMPVPPISPGASSISGVGLGPTPIVSVRRRRTARLSLTYLEIGHDSPGQLSEQCLAGNRLLAGCECPADLLFVEHGQPAGQPREGPAPFLRRRHAKTRPRNY